ncbi:MAG TPA: ribosome silencing factor [Ktedonobacterales bacterium]|nr:ribosome silencing factor [Ktedonobacterales bacterium]
MSGNPALLRHDILMMACGADGAHVCLHRTREGRCRLEPAEIAKILVDAAADKKASDITLLDIRDMSVIADYFVICTGTNSRQIQAIASAIEDAMSELHVYERGREGDAETGWLLLDFGDIIVHIFGPMEREFYRLERLWSGAPTVVYLQ